MSQKMSTMEKVIETGFLVAIWIALGLYLEIVGPTQKDLIITTNSNYEEVATATSGRSIGLFPGCVVGGLLVDKFGHYCHLLIALCLDIGALVTFIIPWLTDVEYLWVCCFIGGAVEAAINVAGQQRILHIWKEKSASPMILLHMGYGIGSFIVPLYANPFLAIPMTATDTNCSTVNATQVELLAVANCTEDASMPGPARYIRETRVQYPFSISASLVALLSVAFFIYQIREIKKIKEELKITKFDLKTKALTEEPTIDTPEVKRSLKEMLNPATCAGGHFWYGTLLFAILFFFFANNNGGERLAAQFLRSYSIDQLGFSSDNGSYVNTAFWISFAIGRLVFFLLARWISIRLLVMIETGGLMLTAILLTIFARDNAIAYWVLVQALALFEAPCWPSMVAWTDVHMELTGLGMTLILLGGSIGGFIHLRIIGYTYEHLGPQSYLYHILTFSVLMFVSAVLLNIVGSRHGNRFVKDAEVDDNEKVEDEEETMLQSVD